MPSRHSSLSLVTLRLMRLSVIYRLERLKYKLDHLGQTGIVPPWRPATEKMKLDLVDAGYLESSENWLEHYVVACFHALALQDDKTEMPDHRPYAQAAVRALDRAQRCGGKVEFVTSKQFWLLAGDPDLAGLRHYDCFRAFEGRVYLRPQPPAPDPAKYELFHYLRLGVESGASQMEQLWLARAELPAPAHAGTIENWFREERRAWEICARLGRFHRQWQTRSAGLDGLRRLASTYGESFVTPPYPEAIRDHTLLTMKGARNRIAGMESLLHFLAHQLGTTGHLSEGTDSDDRAQPRVMQNTRAWIWYSEQCGRGEMPYPWSADVLRTMCQRRAAVWTALRQWATTPARRDETAFREAVRHLVEPPRTRPDRDRHEIDESAGDDTVEIVDLADLAENVDDQ